MVSYVAEYSGANLHSFARWRHFDADSEAEARDVATLLAPPKATGFNLYAKESAAGRVTLPAITAIRFTQEGKA